MTDNTKTQEELDGQMDEGLLHILKNGVDVATKDGTVHVDAPAQYFEIARKRLKDLRTSEAVEGDNSAASRLAAELERDPGALETHGVPEFIAEPSEEPETAVG